MTPAPRGRLATILRLASIVEGVTGLALLLVPALVIRLLLGAESEGVALAIARLCGIALAMLGWACWPGRRASFIASNGARAMLAYNATAALFLGWLGTAHGPVGWLLWPAVVLHAVIAALLVHSARHEN
ncbi:hypothetical protein [Variovorax saccharolyticus]|uniref:hypothetical protein n=1 Tax=Variovorax saccharolyticus TaxID=3053516 RepID=UPI002576DEC2|nr:MULTISPECIES: hypothetical protein [unclassified Variovorax]MDM0022449.1 hypothetical protein [Variovorax sp. J22R187]MDM0028213.1 hypothetical protein [Variovorax sp. J31P216]